MSIVWALLRIIVGVIFGLIAALTLSPAAAAFTDSAEGKTPLVMLAVVFISAALGFFAPSMRRAFGRGFLLAGLSFLALPISVMMLSGKVANELVTSAPTGDQTPAAIGSGLAAVAMTGAATFFGLIVGAILIIIGLVLALGGKREVVVTRTQL